MTSCPTQSTLQSHVDGELPAVRAQAVARHLAGCATCRRQVASMRAVQCILSAADLVSPPEGLMERVNEAVTMRGEGLACDLAHELVVLALDREAGPEQLAQLESHLDECADCRFWAERTGLLVGGLRRVEAIAPPAGLRERVEAAVDKVAASGSVTVRRLLPHELRRRVAAVAGLAAAAAIMFAVLFRFAGAPAPTEMPVPAPTEVAIETPAPEAVAEAPAMQHDAAVETAAPVEAPVAETVRAAETAQPRHATSDTRSAPAAAPVRSTRVAAAVSSPPTEARPVSRHDPAGSPTAVSVTRLIDAGPVDVVRRTEVSVPPTTTVSDAAHTMLTTPIKTTVVTGPRTPSAPTASEATLAKASPGTPTLRTSETPSAEAAPTRLAAAAPDNWLPVHEPSRSVYTAPAASPSRLATASERISREVSAMRPEATTPAIVVIK